MQATEKQIALGRKLGLHLSGLSKEDASTAIDTAINRQEESKGEKPQTTKEYNVWAKEKSTKTMYVSYSKDIFMKLCDLYPKDAKNGSWDFETLMKQAILLVKIAENSFE